jgi:hypothetical protein
MLTLRELFRQTILPPLRAAGFWDYTDYYGGRHMKVVRASCVKPYPDRLLVAVQFIDDRGNGQNLECRVWVVPWHHADDSLERLQLGLRVTAFDAYEVSEEAAAGIARRVLALDRLVPAVREHVLAELAAPPLPSYRARVYRAERRLVEAVVGGREPAAAEAWRAVLADLAAVPARQFKASTVGPRVARFVREQSVPLQRLAAEAELPYQLSEDMPGPFDVEAFYSELVRRRAEPSAAADRGGR